MQATLQPTAIGKESAAIPQAAVRNLAIDTYRGLVMLLMMAEVLELSRVARAFPGNWFWGFLAYNQTHVQWAGCSLHDTIQPGFSFLVGVALPYSMARRIAQGGHLLENVQPRPVALAAADRARRFPALHAKLADLLHV